MRLFDAGARDGSPAVVHDRVFTVANGITILRLAGLPLFVWLMLGPAAYGLAFAVLVTVAATDWVDGYVARRFDQVTKLGRTLDPLIDRILLATAGITLVVVGFVHPIVVALFVVRDAVLLAASYIRFGGVAPIPVNRTGKFATACLLIGVPSFLVANLDFAYARVFMVLAWAFTIVGIVAYYAAGLQYVRVALGLPRMR